MLYVDHLSKNYGKFLAVNNLSLHIPKGDLFGFVGPNGAGKTTTIRMICGLLKPAYGQINIAGFDSKRHMKELKRAIGYVPDFFGVYENLKVSEYMEFYGSIYGVEGATMRRMTGDLLALVNLSDKEDVYVDTLSRGMKQRLCVARALIHNPQLLVLDEPSSGLDPRARVEMRELLMNLNSMGKTIIISSHILADIAEMCNSVGIMNRGRLVTAGTMEDILEMGKEEKHLIIELSGGQEKVGNYLQTVPGVKIQSLRENEVIVSCGGSPEEINRIIGGMIGEGILIGGFRKEEKNLESLFLQLTGENMAQPAMQVQPAMQTQPVHPVQGNGVTPAAGGNEGGVQ